jgi:sigma-54 specific flagellar transcriptional regulator A
MPPLRGRLDDIPALVTHFARRMAPAGAAPIRVADDLMHVFQCYDWPGNIRELANLIDRLSVLYPGGRLSVTAVPEAMLPRGMRLYAQQMAQMSDHAPEQVAGEAAAPNSALEDEGALLFGAGDTQPAPPPPAPSFGFSMAAQEAVNPCDDQLIPAGVRSVEEIVLMVEESAAQDASSDLAVLPDDGLHLKDHLAEIEKALISQALDRSGGNISQTARLLRLQRTTLIEKINKYALRAS